MERKRKNRPCLLVAARKVAWLEATQEPVVFDGGNLSGLNLLQ